MKTIYGVIAVIGLAVVVGFLGVHTGYKFGYDEGYNAGYYKAYTECVVDVPIDTYTLYEEGYFADPSIDEEWLKSFLESIQSANVTFEYDNRGFQTGFISIYLERKRDCSLCDKIEMWMSSENATEITFYLVP